MKEVQPEKPSPRTSKFAKPNGTKKTADKTSKTTDKNKNDFVDTSSDEEVLSAKKSKKGRPSKKTAKPKTTNKTSKMTDKTSTSIDKVAEKSNGHADSNGIAYHTEPSKSDPTKTVVVLDKPKPVFSKTKPVVTTSDDPEPVTFNQYYRHKCKLAKVKTAKQITGQVCNTVDPDFRNKK